jgi:RNA recognition motif-containing protein
MKNQEIHSVYIGNLNYNNEEGDILGLFKKFGYIKNIKIMREGKLNKSKGFAFVDMVNLQEAKKAIEALDGKEHGGRTLKVSLAQTQNFKEKPKEFGELKPRNPKKELDNLVKKQRRQKKRLGVKDIFTKD